MKFLGFVILVVLVLIAAFAMLNWSSLATPVPVSLLVAGVDMPLGLILLAAMVLLVALFGLYVLLLRTAMHGESRRMAQELAAQRDLADKAEASRFTELRTHLDREVAGLRELIGQSQAQSDTRSQSRDTALQQSLSESINSLSACIGQVDDKLDRALSRG